MSNWDRLNAGPSSDWKQQRIHELEAENKGLRKALRRIADAESGLWGRIAHEALYDESPAEAGLATPKMKQPAKTEQGGA